jgi:hypothetical protein
MRKFADEYARMCARSGRKWEKYIDILSRTALPIGTPTGASGDYHNVVSSFGSSVFIH